MELSTKPNPNPKLNPHLFQVKTFEEIMAAKRLKKETSISL